jgi:hypothetical protein
VPQKPKKQEGRQRGFLKPLSALLIGDLVIVMLRFAWRPSKSLIPRSARRPVTAVKGMAAR